MLLGLGIYVGTHREGATCFVFNGAVREKDKKLFDNARNVGGAGREVTKICIYCKYEEAEASLSDWL